MLTWYRQLIRLRRELGDAALGVERHGKALTMRRGAVRVIGDFEQGDVRIETDAPVSAPNA
jgi:hypothetical protein